MTVLLPRWRLFPRQIRCDLNLYHRLDIREWHEGRISSSCVLDYLDGLPDESWYKLSVARFIQEMEDEQEDAVVTDVRSLIFAQLHGQRIEASSEQQD